MGGRSSSSSQSNPVTTNTDARSVFGEGAITAQGGSNITLVSSDQGAVEAGTVLGLGGLQLGQQLGKGALDANLNALLASLGFAQHQADSTFDALDSFSARLATNATNSAREVSNVADQAFSSVNRAASMLQEAYADSKGTTASLNTIVLAALGVAAVVAFAALRK